MEVSKSVGDISIKINLLILKIISIKILILTSNLFFGIIFLNKYFLTYIL